MKDDDARFSAGVWYQFGDKEMKVCNLCSGLVIAPGTAYSYLGNICQYSGRHPQEHNSVEEVRDRISDLETAAIENARYSAEVQEEFEARGKRIKELEEQVENLKEALSFYTSSGIA